MARMRRRSTTRGYERKIEHREWFTVAGVESFNLASNTTIQLRKLFNEALRGDDCTILRTRGLMTWESEDVAAGVGINCVLGMTHLPAKFSTLADSMLPNPLNETESDDWYVWQPVGAIDSASPELQIVDSKAMRKLPSDYQSFGVLGYQSSGSPGASVGIVLTYTFRILVGY